MCWDRASREPGPCTAARVGGWKEGAPHAVTVQNCCVGVSERPVEKKGFAALLAVPLHKRAPIQPSPKEATSGQLGGTEGTWRDMGYCTPCPKKLTLSAGAGREEEAVREEGQK